MGGGARDHGAPTAPTAGVGRNSCTCCVGRVRSRDGIIANWRDCVCGRANATGGYGELRASASPGRTGERPKAGWLEKERGIAELEPIPDRRPTELCAVRG